MRKILVLAAAVLISGVATTTAVRAQSTQTKPAEATKVCTMKVTGMTCSGCEAAVKIAAKQIDGVKDAKASLATRKGRLRSPTIPPRHRRTRSRRPLPRRLGTRPRSRSEATTTRRRNDD